MSLIACSTSDVLSGEYKGEKVEVKSLKDECKGLEDFLVEASILTSLSHPNLVKLIGVSVDQKPVYFITEFMEKGSLYDYLRSRDRSVIQKSHQAAFAQDVCSGMAYLEQRDLVHRFVVCIAYIVMCVLVHVKFNNYIICHYITYGHTIPFIVAIYMESNTAYECQHVLHIY